MREPLIQVSAAGLFCPAGGFHVDPWLPVERAVTTHAHADHARPGSRAYLATPPGAAVLRARLGPQIAVESLEYGRRLRLGGVTVSLHPAGHCLGSCQVRIEAEQRVWVVSGDYATTPDPTTDPFEPVPCDVFVSECTYGLPIFRWPAPEQIFAQIASWWRGNQRTGRTSVLFAGTLGKAQRLLAGLDRSIGPIFAHGAVCRMVEVYRAAGVDLPALERPEVERLKAAPAPPLVLAPPAARGSDWMRRFGPCATGFASGLMQVRGARRRRNVERGFVLSDHADWAGLHRAIRDTGAGEIHLTHGHGAAMARFLAERGLQTTVYATGWEGEVAERAAEDQEPQP
jgi:putative mRNA 3-end processing factor